MRAALGESKSTREIPIEDRSTPAALNLSVSTQAANRLDVEVPAHFAEMMNAQAAQIRAVFSTNDAGAEVNHVSLASDAAAAADMQGPTCLPN